MLVVLDVRGGRNGMRGEGWGKGGQGLGSKGSFFAGASVGRLERHFRGK